MRQTKLFTLLFVSILFFGLFSVSSAQVIEGDVILSTQAEVNSFAGTSITGNLAIQGSDIVDLTPLSALTSVGGDLIVWNNAALTNLDGLSNLTSVGGGLSIYGNIAVTNLDGLSNLTSVGGFLAILSSPALTNLAGLNNLTSVGGNLSVQDNSALTNLDGLSNLTSVGSLKIGNNAALTNLAGLNNLTSVGGHLYVDGNTALTNLDGLSNLTSVGGILSVYRNTSLNRFCGLYPLLSSGGLGGSYNVNENLVNPTQQQITDDGPCITSALAENELLPKYYNLQQNYPNPFNPQTTIVFYVKELTTVSLNLYNIRGQLISTLVDKMMQPGRHKLTFNAADLASGIYFYHIKMGEYQSIKKMILLQ